MANCESDHGQGLVAVHFFLEFFFASHAQRKKYSDVGPSSQSDDVSVVY